MSLANKAASGFLWTSIASFGARFVTIGSTFVLTRYLAPEVQGEVNLAVVLVGTLGAALSLGAAQYVTAHPEEGRETAFHGSLLIAFAGVLVVVASLALAAPVAALLNIPGMAAFVPGLALSHFLDRLGWMPRSILLRDLRFRLFGLRVALGELVFALVSVGAAYEGWGGDAIVAGNLARATVGLVFYALVTNWRDSLEPCRLMFATFVRMLRFGVPLTVASFFHMGATNWDNSFMGYRFGEATVGVYNQAYRLSDLPAATFGDQINDVLVPTFARLDQIEARRRGFLRAVSLLALLVFPAATGLSAVAPTLVEAFYPPSYRDVAPFLVVLAATNMTRAIGNLAGVFLQVQNRTGTFALIDGLLVVMVLGIMALLSPLGAVASAAGVGVAFTLAVYLTLRVLSSEGIRVAQVISAAFRPFLACLPLALAVVGTRAALAHAGAPAWLSFLAEVSAGAAAYVGACFVIAPAIARDFLALGRSTLARRRGAAS